MKKVIAFEKQSLKSLIDTKQISQRALARYLGISTASLSRYINKKRVPDVRTAIKIAEYFGVDVRNIW